MSNKLKKVINQIEKILKDNDMVGTFVVCDGDSVAAKNILDGSYTSLKDSVCGNYITLEASIDANNAESDPGAIKLAKTYTILDGLAEHMMIKATDVREIKESIFEGLKAAGGEFVKK